MYEQQMENLKNLLAEFLWCNELVKRDQPVLDHNWSEVTDQWKQTYIKDAEKIIAIIESKHWEHLSWIIAAMLKN